MVKRKHKIVVLDTSVLLYDARSIYGFRGSDIVIPLVVLSEIDKYKNVDDEVGRNARLFARSIKGFLSNGADLRTGAKRLPTDELLIVKNLENVSLINPLVIDINKNDDVILAVCLEVDLFSDIKVKLVTRDTNMHIKASYLGIACEDYVDNTGYVEKEDLYSGIKNYSVPTDYIEQLYLDSKIDLCIGGIEEFIKVSDFDGLENVGVVLNSLDQSNQSALAVYKSGVLHKLKYTGKAVSRVTPKCAEQHLAMEFLLDRSIDLVTLTGGAGVGKTLLALACGLKMIEQNMYRKFVVSRPIQPLGRDLGFLPGDTMDKLQPWLAPIRDSVEFIYGGSEKQQFEDLVAFGTLEIEPLTYIRGRSMPNTLFLVDEGQQLTKHEMKTIISRMGKGSKIILTGDIFQIDNPYLDTCTNGLTRVVELFKPYSLSAHVSLTKGQRSDLATLAANIL